MIGRHARERSGMQVVFTATIILVILWALALGELYRNQQAQIREAELVARAQAEVFAEYSRSTIKRINQVILDLRGKWNGDWNAFDAQVRQVQQNIDDLTFQVAIIDSDGRVGYTNLSKPTDPRADLSEREHFRVHRDSRGEDRLFISRPLLGKVSGKWTIQVTRPVLRNGVFSGVMVISLDPDRFAGFGETLGMGAGGVISVVRNSGEIMARYPAIEGALGLIVSDRPYLAATAPLAGTYRASSPADGGERVWGYHRIPEYGMIFVVGRSMEDVLAGWKEYRTLVLASAVVVTLLLAVLFFLLYRMIATVEGMRAQLNIIFRLSPDGIVSFDGQHQVRFISPAFERMTGLDRNELLGLTYGDFVGLLLAHCAPGTQLPHLLAEREDGDSGLQGQTVEYALPQKCFIQISRRHGSGRNVAEILYFRDVTLESELDRMKSEFLSVAAHELRTPMSSILGFAELLLMRKLSPEETRESLEIIVRQSQLMTSIINELLDLVRIEARRGADFRFETLEANDFVREAVAAFMPPGGRDAPTLDLPDAAISLRADREKLAQALGNVLSNAYKYSSPSATVEVRVLAPEAMDKPGFVGLQVTDRGIGMTAEELARVGERFYRADTSGKIPGTGLGMSIVNEIVTLSGGRVDIASQPEEGTTVTLWLPQEGLPPPAVPKPQLGAQSGLLAP